MLLIIPHPFKLQYPQNAQAKLGLPFHQMPKVILFGIIIKEYWMAYKNKNIVKNEPFFTHFASLPIRLPHQRDKIAEIQHLFRSYFHKDPQYSPEYLREHNHKLSHLTLFKLILRHNSTRERLAAILKEYQEHIQSVLVKYPLQITGINYFTRLNKNTKSKEVTVIYLEVAQPISNALVALTDQLIRTLLKEEILATQELKDMNVFYDHNSNLYRPETLHISLFRANSIFDDERFQQILKQVRAELTPLQFQWTSFDISTMKEFDTDEFYLPLIRLGLEK